MTDEIKVKQKPGPKPKSKTSSVVGREENAHTPEGRGRVPMGVGYNIEYPEDLKDPNFFYYFAADRGSNLRKREKAGFAFVKLDGKKYIECGRDGVDMYLMRQPMKYRLEDLELKRNDSSAIVKAEQTLQEGEYIPDGRTSKVQKDSELDPMQP